MKRKNSSSSSTRKRSKMPQDVVNNSFNIKPYNDDSRLFNAFNIKPYNEPPKYQRNSDELLLDDITDIMQETTLTGEKNTYTLLFERGHGSFGTVWEARTNDNNRVAVKIFQPDAIDYSIEKEFGTILKANGKCNPFVVCIMDTGYHLINPFIVYELMDGDLSTYIFNSHDEILQCMEETCKGLRWLHEKFIAHSDIKPSNLLYKMGSNQRMIFKIGDLGGACAEVGVVDARINFCTNRGTFLYMAPEIISNREQPNTYLGIKQSDIYSLGVTFFYIVTKFLLGTGSGYLPFNEVGGIPYTDLIKMHLDNRTKIPALRQDELIKLDITEKTPEVKLIEEIVNNMIQVNPNKRMPLNTIINKIEAFNRY